MISQEIESIIRIEARTAHSSPHGKDNPETFAYIAGATQWAERIPEFLRWANKNYWSTQTGIWFDRKDAITTDTKIYSELELLTLFINRVKQ